MYRLRKVTEQNIKQSEPSGSFKYRTNAGKIPIGNVLDINILKTKIKMQN